MQWHLIIINNKKEKNAIDIVFVFTLYVSTANKSVVCAEKKICWSHVLTIYQPAAM